MYLRLCGARASRPPCGTRGVRARLRAVGQPSRASLVLEEVGVRHVERHSRLRSSDELSALHAPLDDDPRHADVRHPADAVACELAADDEAQPPAQRGDDERALFTTRLYYIFVGVVAPLLRRPWRAVASCLTTSSTT